MTKAAKKTRAPAVAKDPRRAPTEMEQSRIDAALLSFRENRLDPPEIVGKLTGDSLEVGSPHTNDVGHALDCVASLGLRGSVMLTVIQNNLLNLHGGTQPTTEAEAATQGQLLRQGMAFVQALEPQSSLEAVIAVQMWAAHLATMSLSRKLHRATELPQFEAYGKLMNKTARTFATQVDTLQRLRTGGKQTHEVRYVYVDQRTQTVVNAPGGGGGSFESLPQPHTKALGHAPVAPLWSADEAGDALPIASGEGAQAVSDARRD